MKSSETKKNCQWNLKVDGWKNHKWMDGNIYASVQATENNRHPSKKNEKGKSSSGQEFDTTVIVCKMYVI